MSEFLVTGAAAAVAQPMESSAEEDARTINRKNRPRAGKRAASKRETPAEEELDTEYHILDSTA